MTSTPPPTSLTRLSFPAPHVLLITLDRPRSLNCIDSAGHVELDAVYAWYDGEPGLRAAVLTGSGRAFCAGADLKEWRAQSESGEKKELPPSGFGALSRRAGKKPVIVAANGLCLGGGMEMAINADVVVASRSATFGLPEVKRGVVALAGALPRLVRTVGRQRAMELALTGRTLSADEAERWGIVNKVVPDGEVVREAVKLAVAIAGNSPDAVIVSREGVKLGWEGVGADEASEVLIREWWAHMEGGENITEGLRAFGEKRAPKWVPSKL
ncbi:MAG: hypothetical protein M1832_002143 [Thelocarpon impressellum]|nr:MAG: hypothetical protein M1832_002143 [Thelocarpon impressellum]